MTCLQKITMIEYHYILLFLYGLFEQFVGQTFENWSMILQPIALIEVNIVNLYDSNENISEKHLNVYYGRVMMKVNDC